MQLTPVFVTLDCPSRQAKAHPANKMLFTQPILRVSLVVFESMLIANWPAERFCISFCPTWHNVGAFQKDDEIVYLWPNVTYTVSHDVFGNKILTPIEGVPNNYWYFGKIMQKEVQHGLHLSGMVMNARQGFLYKVRFRVGRPLWIGADRRR